MAEAFPTARQIARALVTAARAHGEDPIEVAEGATWSRARFVALVALTEICPKAKKAGLARCLGAQHPDEVVRYRRRMKKLRWWRDELVDEVVGAILADGEDEEKDRPRIVIHARKTGKSMSAETARAVQKMAEAAAEQIRARSRPDRIVQARAAPAGDAPKVKYRLKTRSGEFLHMTGKLTTRNRSYAWRGTMQQARSAMRKFPAAKGMTPIKEDLA